MFENLLESRPGRERSLGKIVVSTVTHGALIAAAVTLTRNAAAASRASHDPVMAFARTEPPKPEPERAKPRVRIPDDKPAVRGFTVLVAPLITPTAIPPVDIGGTFDKRDFTGIGSPGGVPDGVIGGTPTIEQAIGSATYQSDQVEEPAQVKVGALPRYPTVMRISGISGAVTMEFVVTAEGKADEGTIRIVKSSDPRFDEAAREAVLHSTYSPAKLRGAAVRQLVVQTVTFSLTP